MALKTHIRLLTLLGVLALWPQALWGQDEDPRGLVVRGLSFSGNHAIDDFTLRISIGTSESSTFARWPILRWMGLGQKRFFDETEFRRDVLRILLLYRQIGFREVGVDTIVRRSSGDVYIQFLIEEGEPVRVTSLGISGIEGIVAERAVVRELPLRVGDPFNLLLLQASVDTIGTMLRNRGYPFPEVFTELDVIVADHTAKVSLQVLPGSRAIVAAVEVSGTDEIDESVILRAVSVRPGQLFSERELERSRLDLYRMSLFNFVSVGLADSIPSESDDTTVTVRVRVAEAALRRLRLGVGYGTIDCFRTLGAWTVHDFLGGGRTFDLSTRLSKIGVASPVDGGFENNVCGALDEEDELRLKLNFNATASLREPFFLSRRTSAAVSFTAERHSEFQAFVRQSVGGELSVTWRTPIDIPIVVSYALSSAKTDADPASFCSFLNVCRVEDTEVFTERRYRSMAGLSFVWDRSDSRLDPTRGSRLTGELSHASTFIGSDSLIQFTRGVVEFASYHRVARRSVFAWRVRLGAVGSPTLNLAGGGRRFVPPEDRLYGGGPNSVRGFGQNELGPIVHVLDTVLADEGAMLPDSIIRRSAVGGNRLLFANAELRFPLPVFSRRVFGAVFVDAGQVFESGVQVFESGVGDEGLTDIRVTPGVGLRIATPLGPMRLDIAYNGYKPRSSPLYRTVKVAEEEGELVLVNPLYVPERGFFGRFRIHFSVGQAF